MSVPGPVTVAVTGGLVLSGANQASKQIQDFLAAVTGHPGESIGTILGNLMRRRQENAEGIVNKAHFTLLNLGIEPGPVPLNVLYPVLEVGSLQEDAELQEKWANLLANAGDPRQGVPVSPVFAETLKNLTVREVKFLDAFYDLHQQESNTPRGIMGPIEFSDYEIKAAYAAVGLSRQPDIGAVTHGMMMEHGDDLKADLKEFDFSLNLVVRLGIVTVEEETEPIDLRSIAAQIQNKTLGSSLKVRVKTSYTFTTLGLHFLAACRKPPAKS